MVGVPLVRHGDGEAVLAYQGMRSITVGGFLRDVAALARTLPDRPHILNLCSDRYRFSVGFAAALLRGQVSLLPPNHTPAMVRELLAQYPGLYALSDDPAQHAGLETLNYPALDSTDDEAPAVPEFPARQRAAIVFTSGSTGRPLPHDKSWGAIAASAVAEARSLGIAPDSGLVLVGTVPPQHMYGLESTVLMALQNGLALHSGRPFYPADICAAVDAMPRPRMLVTTPIHLRALLEASGELPPLDRILCATAPLSPQLAAQAEARFAAPLFEIYGCTEAGQVASRRTVETAEWRTFEGIRLRQDGRGTWAAGGSVDTEALLSDVIELRDAQTFLLHGRMADLVNIAGKRTSLAHLNFQLNAIEGVRDGAFFLPDETSDSVTRLMAFVVAPELSAEALARALRERIDAAFLPRPLCFVDALPRNSTGKLTRDSLRRLAAAQSAKARPA